MSVELLPRICNQEAPINRGLLLVALLFPRGDFFFQRRLVSDTTTETCFTATNAKKNSTLKSAASSSRAAKRDANALREFGKVGLGKEVTREM